MIPPRFQPRERVGRGANGEVYRAFDLQLGHEVAIKILHSQSSADLSLLKDEFRIVADVSHPSVVEVHDLVITDGQAVVSMEWLGGPPVVEGCRPSGAPDYDRIRRAFADLAGGLQALHDAGIVHRDVSSGNARFDATGRAKLLDFGLGVRQQDGGAGPAGALAYLAPEALLGEVGPEGDWFALGVLLFEALTGERPFSERLATAVLEKQAGRARRAPSLRDAPADLMRVCTAWLAPNPEDRGGVEQLGPELVSPRDQTRLVGRGRELSAVREFLGSAGASAWALVRGPSGIGKTRLVEEATRSVEPLLRARCHPREHIRFNALDSIVDQAVAALRPIGIEVDPAEQAALVHLFPTTAKLFPSAGPSLRGLEGRDRALSGLATLLSGVARDGSVTLWIDDAQWMDDDSRVALDTLLRAPTVRLRVIVTVRTELSPSILALLDKRPPSLDLTLGPLSPDDIAELLHQAEPGRPALDSIVGEAQGNPFLALQMLEPGGQLAPLERLRVVGPEAEQVFNLVAVAGQPLELPLIQHALGPGAVAVVPALRKRHLLRPLEHGDERLLTYHDRLRETHLSSMEPNVAKGLQRRLVDAFFALGSPDPDRVVEHLLAVEDSRAPKYLLLAAEQAFERFAFTRARDLYETAVGLPSIEEETPLAFVYERAGLSRARLGDAVLGAQWLERAVEQLPPGDADGRRLTRRRAELLLQSGHFEAGRQALAEAMEQVGLSVPSAGAPALARFVWERARLRFARSATLGRPISARDCEQLEALQTAAVSLAMVYPVEGLALGTRWLRRAKELGEPRSLTIAYAVEAALAANLGGPKNRKRSHELLRMVEKLVKDHGGPYEQAWLLATHGSMAFCEGRDRDAVRHLEEMLAFSAANRFADDELIEKDFVRVYFFLIQCRAHLGDMKALAQELRERLAVAEARGDVQYAEICRHGRVTLAYLAEDRPDEAIEQSRRALRESPAGQFGGTQIHHLVAIAAWALYVDRPEEAWAVFERDWGKAKRGQILAMEMLGCELRHARARVALGMAAKSKGRERKHYLAIAHKDERAIGATRIGHSYAYVASIEAGRVLLEGDRSGASSALRRAKDGFGKLGMKLHYALSDALLGEGHGPSLLAAEGVKRTTSMSATLFPAQA